MPWKTYGHFRILERPTAAEQRAQDAKRAHYSKMYNGPSIGPGAMAALREGRATSLRVTVRRAATPRSSSESGRRQRRQPR